MYNVMIVDDESVIKKGLLCFVNWKALECSVIHEASNGFEAKEFLNSTPLDIVVTDIKMPGMDGLELSKYIYENYPDIKIIILTAYADFSYAQSAIKYNVVDFIVKINPSEKIPEAVNKAKELILQQKIKKEELKVLENRINDNMSEIREKFFKEVLNGIIIKPEIIKIRADEYGINLQNYFIIAYEINSIVDEKVENSIEEHNKFIFAVKNFLSLAFKDYHHYTTIMNKNQLISVVSFTSKVVSSCTHILLMVCNEILSMVESFMKFSICIGISGMHNHIHELASAYNEAQETLSKNFYSDNNVSVYLPNNLIPGLSRQTEVHKCTDDIIADIQNGNDTDAIASLIKLFEEYKNNKEPIEQVKVASIVLCSLCLRLLTNYNLDIPKKVGSEAGVYRQIQELNSIQNLFNLLQNIIKSVSQLIASNEKQYNYLVKGVNKFIRDNYNKDINLQSIADHVHVNKSYLSRMYKKETGESITDTLNRQRIDIAKKMLIDPAAKIFEVATEVGISDPAYFTHVFTKYTGVSPKDYRAKGLISCDTE